MKYSKEIKIGLFALVSFVILYTGINYLRGTPILSGQSTYYVVFNESDGLVKSAPVVYKGFKIGMVRKINFDQENDRIIVSFIASNEFKIPTTAEITIESDGLLGGKVIALKWPPKPDAFFKEKDTLFGTNNSSLTEMLTEELLPMKDNLQSLLKNLDSISSHVNQLFASGNMQQTLEHTANASKKLDQMLASESQKLSIILGNVQSITDNLNKNNGQLTHIFANMASITDSLAKADLVQTLNHAKKTLEETQIAMQKINKGEGSLGLLLNDKKLYDNLNQSASNLDKLMIDLRANPNRYVHFSLFGRKQN